MPINPVFAVGDPNSKNNNIQANQRRAAIANYVISHQEASVQELSAFFNVSMVTIRGDLAALDKANLVERTHGGATILHKELVGEIAFQSRARMHQEEKACIGARAAELIDDGDSILIDSSTTCFYVARNLKTKQDLKIVTNGLNTSLELLKYNHTIIMVGGMLNEKTYGTVGRLGRNTLSEIRVAKAFFGARGVSLRDGLTDASLLEVELKQIMVEASSEVYVVVDSSKFNVVGFASFAPISRVTAIITDSGIDPAVKASFEEHGVHIIIA
jgi:DeoR family fructose operon transcriptional repressor